MFRTVRTQVKYNFVKSEKKKIVLNAYKELPTNLTLGWCDPLYGITLSFGK